MSLGKDPATLFYWNDWFGGTYLLTRHEKGAYMDLLYAQFNNRGPLAPEQVRHVLGETDYNAIWHLKLLTKFTKTEDGKFFNQRLQHEIDKRAGFVGSRKKNAAGTETTDAHATAYAGASADTHAKALGTILTKHMGKHSENVNVNEIEYVFEDKIELGIEEKDKPALAKIWRHWLEYKFEQFGFKYKSSKTEKANINKLIKLAGGNITAASDLVDCAVERGWRGFWPLPENYERKNDKRTGTGGDTNSDRFSEGF